jgi:type IV secretory pathway VirB6-like protein
MAEGIPSNFLDDIYNKLIEGLNKYTFEAYAQLVEAVGPVLSALVTLYIVVQGIRIFLGYNESSVNSFAKKSLLLGFVTVLATNWHVFSSLIVATVVNTPEGLINALITGNASDPTPGSTRDFFSTFLNESLALFIEVFKEGGLRNFSAYIIGIIGIIAVCILVVAIFVLLITAQVSLSVLLVLAPLVIPTYLFESSRSICMAWARMLITSMFVPILVYAISGLFMQLLRDQLDALKGEDAVNMYSIVAYAITVVISLILIRQVPMLASGIGSGVTYASAGGSPIPALKLTGKGIGWAGGKAYDQLLKKHVDKLKDKWKNRHNVNASNTQESAGENKSSIIIPNSYRNKLTGYGN